MKISGKAFAGKKHASIEQLRRDGDGKFSGNGTTPQSGVHPQEAARQKTLVRQGARKESFRELHTDPHHGLYYVEKSGKKRPVYKDPGGIGMHKAKGYTF